MDLAKKTPEVVVNGVVESYRWVRDLYTAVKHGQYRPYSPLERKVREATRNEPWGPTGTMLNELAEASFRQQDCYVIFAIVELRLGYPADKWRNVYKALTVLEFIMKRGSDTWVTLANGELMPKLEQLEEFAYIDEKGHDQGINVRHRAAAIRALLASPRLLDAEREAAKKKRQQYQGYSRNDMVGSRSPNNSHSYSSATGGGDDGAGFGRFSGDGDDRLQYHREAASESNGHRPAQPPVGRNAGEMKGVTLEENKRNLARLKEILGRPENRVCADCSGGSSSRPTWASINTGVFICMQCAGIHRGLGVHISKVRSCTLDTWLPEQVAFLSNTGNTIANSYWEARLPPHERPATGSDRQVLASFIRAKYSGQWAQGEWPPSAAVEQELSVPQPVAAEPAPSPATRPAPPPAAAQPPRQSAFARANSVRTASTAPTTGGAFWSKFEAAGPAPAVAQESSAPTRARPQPQPQPSRQPQRPPQPQPPVAVPTFDLLGFDDDVSQPPLASPAFSDASWGAAFTPVPTAPAAAPALAASAPAAEPMPLFDLLSFEPEPVPMATAPAAPHVPAARVLPPPESTPAVHPPPAGAPMGMGIEELAQSPNIMDAQELYMPSPQQQPLPETQMTGASVVFGLDDLLAYQYTGMEPAGPSRLPELVRQPYSAAPQQQVRKPAGQGMQASRASWQPSNHRGSSVGVTHFDALQDELMSSFKMASPSASTNHAHGNAPMRAAGR
eukprot:jgi/Tetstr1/430784/TSEL_020569.t1